MNNNIYDIYDIYDKFDKLKESNETIIYLNEHVITTNEKVITIFNILSDLNFNNDKKFYKKIKNIKIGDETRDKHDPEFYYKTIIIGDLIFYYINFDNGTNESDHFLNINNYKIIGPNKNNDKLQEKYKNNISFLFEDMNFPLLTEKMFIKFILIVFNYLKI